MRAALLAAIVLLALAGTAAARPLNADKLEAAQAADVPAGCVLEALPAAELDGDYGQHYTLGGCHIRIRQGLMFLQACTVLAHEAGHARGLEHTAVDDGSIMSLHPDPPAACDRADDRRLRRLNAPLRRRVARRLRRCRTLPAPRRRGCRARARRPLAYLLKTS